jgi:hypothetical protein
LIIPALRHLAFDGIPMGQLQDWLEDFPLEERRPPLNAVESGCPPALLELMVLILLLLRFFTFLLSARFVFLLF